MLKRLRRKFCAITLLLVGLVLVAALGSTFASAVNTQGEITRSMLEKSLEQGYAQPPTLGEGENADRAFVVTLDVSDVGVVLSRSGAAIEVSSDQMADVIAKAIPVSYTHLDVYKRQSGGDLVDAHHEGPQQDGDDHGPVSYTHLARLEYGGVPGADDVDAGDAAGKAHLDGDGKGLHAPERG